MAASSAMVGLGTGTHESRGRGESRCEVATRYAPCAFGRESGRLVKGVEINLQGPSFGRRQRPSVGRRLPQEKCSVTAEEAGGAILGLEPDRAVVLDGGIRPLGVRIVAARHEDVT